jgi:4-hydroxy-tetrahydrodipicolinate synthase
MRIAGVIVPLLTPLLDDETVDEQSLGRLIEHVIAGGVAAIFVLGSSGEAPALRPAQKERIVRLAVAKVAGRVPVLAGVVEPSTTLAVEAARQYAALGADALVPTSPYYFLHDQDDLASHFRAIAEAVDIPVFVYNIPVLAGHTLSPELVASLAKLPNIQGLKDSDGKLDAFQQFLKSRSDTFQVWQGAEPVAAISVVRGADGLVLGLANIAPQMIVAMYGAASSGNLEEAWRLQEQLMQLFPIQRHKSFLAGLKSAANHLDLCGTRVSLPFEELTAEQHGKVRATLVTLGLLADAKKAG